MSTGAILSDFDHPTIKAKAEQLTTGEVSLLEKLESLFYFVRDDVKFGFPPKWDDVKASEVLEYGYGYCNTKATLFVALCKSLGISARIHCGLIDVNIMKGIFPSFAFPFLPKAGPHSWIDVEIDGGWKPIDSYINDKEFYAGALRRLKESGKTIGYSVSLMEGQSSCEFNFGEKGFVHMGAVLEDHGAWEDFSEYMSTDRYVRMNRMQLMAYPMIARLSNRNIERIRSL